MDRKQKKRIFKKERNYNLSLIVQSYRFSTEYFTAEQAREWLKDHKIKYISFHAASKPHSHLFFSPKNSLSQYIPHTLLNDIYAGKKRNYDFDLFKNISDDLTGAIRKAFGKTKVINALNEISPRDNLYYMMEANTFQFSAEKVKDEVAQVNAAFEKNLP